MEKQQEHGRTMKGYLFAVIPTAIWSGNFIIARGLNQSITPVSLAFWRWFVAAVLILPFAYRHLAAERQIIRKHLPYLLVTAFLGVTLFNTLIYFAARSTTAINLSLISITFPIFIVLMTRILFHEKITLYKAAGIILVAAGVIFLITKGNPAQLLGLSFARGDLLMLGAALAFAFYSILLKKKPSGMGAWTLQASTFILGTLLLLPFFIADRIANPPIALSLPVILAVLYTGALASLLAFFLWSKAINTIGPSKSGMVYYSLPLFSGLWSILFLGEEVSILHLISLLLIVPGIIIANLEQKKRV